MIYTKIDINYAVGGNLRRLSAEEAWETIEDCAQYDKQWKNPTSTISDQTIANSKAQLVENEVVRVMIPKCMSWLDDEPIGDLDTMEDKPPVTYPEEVDETIGIPIEVEPLDHTKLEDLGLSTYNHDIPLSFKEIPSVDEPEPQLLPNFSPLDVSLGDKRGTDPPNNPNPVGVVIDEENPEDGVRINPDGVARFLALGWHLEEIHVTWAHLEKKQKRLRLYTKSLKKLYTKSVEMVSRVSSDGVRTFEVTASDIW
ncbi:hypothetical protein Tco_0422523 [Tanacetum coccineum]